MLTEKQKELLLFIHARMQDKGVPPSFDEMKDALDLQVQVRHSPPDHGAGGAGLHPPPAAPRPRHRGHPAAREPGRRRPARAGSSPASSRAAAARDLAPPPSTVIDSRTVSVPVMGRIAAGMPISAIQNHTHDIACPPDLLTSGEHFALEVKGDSMIEAGINEGDTVIIRRCDTAENGDIVVALVEKEEATLKRLRKKGTTIALEAANPEFKTRIFGPDQVDIQGRLVGLMRRY